MLTPDSIAELINLHEHSPFSLVEYSGDSFEQTSYGELNAAARAVWARLNEMGVREGHVVVITCSTDPAFASLYFGALLAGAIPCVLPNPTNELATEKAQSISDLLHATLIIREPTDWIRIDRDAGIVANRAATLRQSDIALIQATSGSTAEPRCVALSNRQVLSNLESMRVRLRMTEADIMVSWLPMYHDMGLIGSFLLPIYVGAGVVRLHSRRFLRKPVSWLRAVSDHRGTISPAPNFGYRYALEHVRDQDLPGIDLSSWRAAVCGSEPIDVSVLRGFSERFSKWGLPRDAATPAFGLAEATLCVSMKRPGDSLYAETVSLPALSKGIADKHVSDHPVTNVCDCGSPLDGVEVKVVDDAGADLEDGHVGRLVVRGPSVMAGYVEKDGQLSELLDGGWLDTGDLAYLRLGGIFVTGRVKDVIVLRGENFDPSEFEWAAAKLSFVESSGVIAVQGSDPGASELLIICERTRRALGSDDELSEQLSIAIVKETGIRPDRVLIVPKNTIQRTTSGKPRRQATRDRVLLHCQ